MKILICDFIYLCVYLKLYTKVRQYMNIRELQDKYVLIRSTKNRTSTLKYNVFFITCNNNYKY